MLSSRNPVFIFITLLLVNGVWAAGSSIQAQAEKQASDKSVPKVVVTLKPVHSLVSALMDGLGEPSLLIDGNQSPHGFILKPSQARSMQEADLLIWIGPQVETALTKPLEQLSSGAVVLELMGIESLSHVKLANTQLDSALSSESHSPKNGERAHDDHQEDEIDEEAHDDHHEDEVDEEAHDDHQHEGGEFDPHIWLNPYNADLIQRAIADRLSQLDPGNASHYEAASLKLSEELVELRLVLLKQLAPVRNRSFIAFHDAYAHFEQAFGLKSAGSIRMHAEVESGIKHLNLLKDKIVNGEVSCVFSEPQFPDKLIKRLIENTKANHSILDPLGSTLPSGSDLYHKMMRDMANQFASCLSFQ